jgi:transposase
VVAEIDGQVDRFAGLRRIGIDEISYKRGHRYLTIVVDHDSGRLVWAAPGRDEKTVQRFFDALGRERAAKITHVSADAAPWIAKMVAARCPDAVVCADPFHVVAWATDALDEVRRQAWNDARGAAKQRTAPRARGKARSLKNARYALWKNPDKGHRPHRQTDHDPVVKSTHDGIVDVAVDGREVRDPRAGPEQRVVQPTDGAGNISVR